jgi:CDGSH-type Zn-finger protein
MSASGATTACAHEGGDCPCVKPEPARPVRAPPAAPASGPVARKLGPGESAWLCTCGQSSTYPFCNGAHRAYNAANGTSYAPMPYTNDKAEEVTACECRGAGRGGARGSSPRGPRWAAAARAAVRTLVRARAAYSALGAAGGASHPHPFSSWRSQHPAPPEQTSARAARLPTPAGTATARTPASCVCYALWLPVTHAPRTCSLALVEAPGWLGGVLY